MRFRVRFLAAAAAAGLAVSPAVAFYFPGWPGAGLPTPRVLIPTDTPSEGNPPSASPPLTEEESVNPPRSTDRGLAGSPSQTPEPGALTVAVIGLATIGVRVALRKSVCAKAHP